MRKHTRRVLATSHIAGQLDPLGRLVEMVGELDVDAVMIVGDLVAAGGVHRADAYREVFGKLGAMRVPTFFVPGAHDAPLDDYLREAYNLELTFPMLHGVHGTLAFAPGHVAVLGMGGEIGQMGGREERERLYYPEWAVEYVLKVLDELKDYEKIFLFATPPAHRDWEKGSQALTTLINTFAPSLVVVDAPHRHHAEVGTSLVVAPGRLSEGDFSIVDLRSRKIEAGNVR